MNLDNSHYQLVNDSCSSSLTIHFVQNKFILRCEVQFTEIKINLQILLRERRESKLIYAVHFTVKSLGTCNFY